MLREIIAKHPAEFGNDDTIFDKLVRAQHYGIPTRLLDMTFDPLVALYFACIDSKHKEKTGRVIVACVPREKRKFFDSDTTSMLSNISLLKANERKPIVDGVLEFTNREIEAGEKQIEDVVVSESDVESLQILCDYISKEKPYRFNRIFSLDLFTPVSVIPKKSHARISAQNGAFLLFGLLTSILENDREKSTELFKKMSGIEFDVIDIASRSKQSILKSLEDVGVSEEALFPEIERSAQQIRRRYS